MYISKQKIKIILFFKIMHLQQEVVFFLISPSFFNAIHPLIFKYYDRLDQISLM